MKNEPTYYGDGPCMVERLMRSKTRPFGFVTLLILEETDVRLKLAKHRDRAL